MKGPAQQFASDYTVRIVEHFKAREFDTADTLPITPATLESYLEIAFNEGCNHAAARYMETGHIPLHIADPRESIVVFGFHAETNPERERLADLMDQVAREAIAAVNESAADPWQVLCVMPSGDWLIEDGARARHWKPEVIKLPVKHYDTAEDLAAALKETLCPAR